MNYFQADSATAVPNFICIGSQRCGTSWLYKNLSRHQDIFLPPSKELHFFDALNIERKGKEDYLVYRQKYRKMNRRFVLQNVYNIIFQKQNRHLSFDADFWWKYYTKSGGTLEWYTGLFQAAAAAGKVTGEITPAYSIMPDDVIQQMRRLSPALKLIYVLRNPIDRSFSQAIRYFVKKHGRDFATVPQQEVIEFLQSDCCCDRSDYLQNLRRYRNYFSEQELLVCFFDEIKLNPKEFLNRVCNFLEISPLEPEQVNQTAVGKLSNQRANPEIRQVLAEMYSDSIAQLSQEFGSYATVWHQELAMATQAMSAK